jgi:hypothetical protein
MVVVMVVVYMEVKGVTVVVILASATGQQWEPVLMPWWVAVAAVGQ